MTVLNKRTDRIPDNAVYIGRGSAWGNPYTHLDLPGIGKPILTMNGNLWIPLTRVADRDAAVESYRQLIWRSLRQETLHPQELAALHGHDLVCYCAPEPCHGDVLASAAAWAYPRNRAAAEAFMRTAEAHG